MKVWKLDELRLDTAIFEKGKVYTTTVKEFLERYANQEVKENVEKKIKSAIRRALRKRGKVNIKIDNENIYVQIE